MLFIGRSIIPLATMPMVTTGYALQDAWASALIMMPVSMSVAAAVAGLGQRYPRGTVATYSRRLLGRFLGTVVCLSLLWLFLVIVATDTRIYAEVLAETFLPRTPVIFIMSQTALVAAIAAYAGVEVVARTADALVVPFAIFVAASIIWGLSAIDVRNLRPVLSRGFGPVLSSVLTPIAVATQFVSLSVLVPSLTRPEKATRSAVVAALSGALVAVLSVLAVTGALGPALARETVSPFFTMMRSIVVGGAMERIEAPAAVAWGFGVFVHLSTLVYCAAKMLAELLGLADYRPLVPPMTVIWVIFAFHAYDSFFDIARYFRPYAILPVAIVSFYLPYAAMWGAHAIRVLLGRGQASPDGR